MEDKKSILITAHSGSDGTPDNSMEFVNYALGTAVDALEIDVRQAANGTLIISHDETGEEAVTLKEVFDAVRGHEKRINCDLKEYGLEEAVNELAVSCGLAEGQILFSGSVKPREERSGRPWEAVEVFWNVEECISDIYVCEAGGEREKITAEMAKKLAVEAARSGYSVININEKYLNEAVLETMRSHHMGISAWTVNEPDRISQLLELGVHNITTRRPAEALKLRGER